METIEELAAFASRERQQKRALKKASRKFNRKLRAERRARAAVIAKAASRPKKQKKGKKARRGVDPFYQSQEWKELRYQAIVLHGGRCQCCGASAKDDGIRINVDHIKPRRRFPHLALCLDNLQVLCATCNAGKSYKDMTDWRDGLTTADAEILTFAREQGL